MWNQLTAFWWYLLTGIRDLLGHTFLLAWTCLNGDSFVHFIWYVLQYHKLCNAMSNSLKCQDICTYTVLPNWIYHKLCTLINTKSLDIKDKLRWDEAGIVVHYLRGLGTCIIKNLKRELQFSSGQVTWLDKKASLGADISSGLVFIVQDLENGNIDEWSSLTIWR